jgi:TRAP-type C4-dicarboxylate transport system substrate-binding protein
MTAVHANRPLLLVAAAALAMAGCSVNKVGQVADPSVTLEALSALSVDDTSDFVKELEADSGGALNVDIRPSTRMGMPDAEAGVIDDVRGGRADIGMVGSRGLDFVGVTSYDALTAPFLIDSYDLLERVLNSEVVDEMAAGLSPIGLVGLGVMPGQLRWVLGRTRSFVEPASFVGATIGISRSAVARDTFAALGASTKDLFAGESIAAIDGVEAHLTSILGNGYAGPGAALNAATPLWPRPIVVFVSKARFDQLTIAQRAMLRRALRAATASTIIKIQARDAEDLATLCRQGISLVASTDRERDELRQAVAPVIDAMRADAASAHRYDAVAQQKANGRGPKTLGCPGRTSAPTPAPAPSAAGEPAMIEGTWQACPTEADILAAGGDLGEAHDNAGCLTFVFRRGAFTESPAPGSFRESPSPGTSPSAGTYELVEPDVVVIHRANGELFSFRWAVFRGELVFQAGGPGAVSPAPIIAVPWVRLGD